MRVASLLVLAACASHAEMSVPTSEGLAIGTIKLSLSNVHVLLGRHPVLVDTGTKGDLDDLDRGLANLGIDGKDIRCAVVTHVHSDHAGLARALQGRGIRIIAGAADIDRARKGDHGELHPTGPKGSLLRPLISSTFMPFTPDVLVGDRYDLHDCGVDGEVVAMAGHTPGSLVVLVAGGKIALVGDLLRGSLIHAREPVEHFFQDDLAMAHARIHELLASGVEWFVLGHGGPARREDVEKAFP